MRRKKLSISLTPEENSLLIKSLNHLRNKLLGENKATDSVEALMIKAMCAPIKKG